MGWLFCLIFIISVLLSWSFWRSATKRTRAFMTAFSLLTLLILLWYFMPAKFGRTESYSGTVECLNRKYILSNEIAHSIVGKINEIGIRRGMESLYEPTSANNIVEIVIDEVGDRGTKRSGYIWLRADSPKKSFVIMGKPFGEYHIRDPYQLIEYLRQILAEEGIALPPGMN